MGKPLLTDEMIARANRGDKFYDKGHFDSEETIVISTDNQIPQSSYDKTRDLNENYDDYDYEVMKNLLSKVAALKMRNVVNFSLN